MALDQRQDYLAVARSFLSSAVYPLQALVDLPFRSIDGLRDYLAGRDALRRENTDMQAKLRVANLQLQRFAALAEENRQLRAVR
jgi:rod shape-determining protein MreC